MKTNFLAKHKWWVLAIVLMIALMAVSVSYSAWDTLSAKAIMNAKGGDFKEKSAWSDYIKGSDGTTTLTKTPEVGDIVTYGKFYQKADSAELAALQWRVVHNENNKLTLLTEQVVVYGNYWGNGTYRNDYYRSTVRSWLNSGNGSLKGSGTTWKDIERYDDNKRSDTLTSTAQLNEGFLDVAFKDGAETLLVPKKITGMRYVVSGYNESAVLGNCKTDGGNNPDKSFINDLVWLPSHNEMYGSNYGDTQMDDMSDKHFKYFSDNSANSLKVAGATNYAWNNGSGTSYYNTSGTGGGTSNNTTQSAAWHWLRSPHPSYYDNSLYVDSSGSVIHAGTYNSNGGVRPAVCVQL